MRFRSNEGYKMKHRTLAHCALILVVLLALLMPVPLSSAKGSLTPVIVETPPLMAGPATSAWPMYQHDAQRTSRSPYSGPHLPTSFVLPSSCLPRPGFVCPKIPPMSRESAVRTESQRSLLTCRQPIQPLHRLVQLLLQHTDFFSQPTGLVFLILILY